MRKILIVLLLGFFVLLGFSIFLKNLSLRRITAQLVSLNTAEIKEFHYRLNMLGFIPVGEAVIYKERPEEYEGRKMYHLSASAFTDKVISPFFSAKAEVDSLVSAQDLNPVLFRQRLFVKNKYDLNKEVYYDQKRGIMTLKGVSRIIPTDTKDPLSAMFLLKRMAPENIRDFEININTNQKNYRLKGSAQLRDTLINKRPCQWIRLKADISRRDKNPYHKSSIAILLIRLNENMPVRIAVFSGGIFLEALLAEIK